MINPPARAQLRHKFKLSGLKVIDAESDAFFGDDEKSLSDHELFMRVIVRRAHKQTKVARGNAKHDLSQCFTLRRTRRHRMLSEMPKGLLFEIFGYLRPADLFRVSQVSMGLQRLLMSRETEALWKDSYRNAPGTPECPGDVVQICWANMLFGSTACYECGSKSGVKVLFTLRRRLCVRCMDKTLLSSNGIQVPELFSGSNWEKVTYGHVVPSAHISLAKRTIYYFPPEEVDKFFAEVGGLMRQVGNNAQTLEDQIERFLAEKRKATVERNEHGKRCVEWEQEMIEARRLEIQQAKEARRQQVCKRFAAMGYGERDLSAIQDHREMNTTAYLTDDTWNAVSPELIALVSQRRDLRVTAEKRSRRAARERALEEEYVQHWKTLPHTLVSYMPSVHHFRSEFEPIVTMLAEDEPVSDAWRARLRGAIAETMDTIRDTMRVHKEHLASLLSQDGPLTGDMAPEARVQLASSVFTPSRQEVNYFGSEILARIFRDWKYRSPPAVQVQERGVKTVRYLLSLAGLGDETTKADLDRTEGRFVCLRCPAARRHDWTVGKDVSGRFVMGWRTAVDHMTSLHTEGEPHMRMLTDKENQSIRLQEEKLRSVPTKRIYGCCRCAVHIGTTERSPWLNYMEMVDHLASVHGVEKGAEEVDFFYDARTWRAIGSNGEVVLPMVS